MNSRTTSATNDIPLRRISSGRRSYAEELAEGLQHHQYDSTTNNAGNGSILVESIVQRMLNDRPSVGMIEKETKSKLKDALEKRVLSSSSSSSSSSSDKNNNNNNKRRYYATSPIVQSMNERCYYDDGGGGTIYVAYVGKGLGKTTACYAFSKMNPKNKVIALTSTSSSSSTSTSTSTPLLSLSSTSSTMDSSSSSSSFLPHLPTCLERMVSLFNLRWGDVPQGFVTTLIRSLGNNSNTLMGRLHSVLPARTRRISNNNYNSKERQLKRKKKKKKNTISSYLIIDEFMSNGTNQSDEKLVRHLQKLIRNTTVCVFLLTSNKESANYLLTLNDDDANVDIHDDRINNNNNGNHKNTTSMRSSLPIQPLVNLSVLDTIRLPPSRSRGRTKGRRSSNNDDDVDDDDIYFDWDTYCCMEWTEQQIQEAIVNDASNDNNNDDGVFLLNKDDKRKRLLREEIAELLTYMPDEERKNTNPFEVKRKLVHSANYHPPITASATLHHQYGNNGNNGNGRGSSIFENNSSIFQQRQHDTTTSSSTTTTATKHNSNNNQHSQSMDVISDVYIEMV